MCPRADASERRDVMRYHGQYTMEDWLRFWEVHVPYMLPGGLLEEPFGEMVRLLRWAIRFIFRAGAPSGTPHPPRSR